MSRNNNNWIKHVKTVAKHHNITYKHALKIAKHDYQRGRGVVGDNVISALDWIEDKTGVEINVLLPEKFRNWLMQHGNDSIAYIQLFNTPVNDVYKRLIDFVSRGQLSENLRLNRDKILHFGIILGTVSGDTWRIERNAKLSVMKYTHTNKEVLSPRVNASRITINQLFSKYRNSLPNKSYHSALVYDAETNNCITFIKQLLRSNNLLTPELEKFIDLPVSAILSHVPITKTLINTLANVGIAANIQHGAN